MGNLHSVLILGGDAVAAAAPATPVQLVHACHRWGFTTVVPATWGDELLAAEVIRRCSLRENRPAIQCSCPRVAERLGDNAAKLDDSIFWLATPAVAAAQYVRALASGTDIHVTYAGGCPGAIDASIDQRMSPAELLLAISSRGIELTAQPMVFENVIPPDRRRHFSAAAGIPDVQRLWQSSAFRIAQPSDIDLSIGVAQLLLSDERVLIDVAPLVGCVCRTTDADPLNTLRSPTPIVRDGIVQVDRAPPATRDTASLGSRHRGSGLLPVATTAPPAVAVPEARGGSTPLVLPSRRNSPAKPALRRQSTWRRLSPRAGVVVTRPSGAVVSLPDRALFRRPEVWIATTALIAVGSFVLGFLVS